jgi:hypothetical protein
MAPGGSASLLLPACSQQATLQTPLRHGARHQPHLPSQIAPAEVLRRDYSYECDIWSCGVILGDLFKYICQDGTEPTDKKKRSL